MFDFSVPITWADIINIISTLFAFLAVAVAVSSNAKAQKQILTSIALQEQAKNVDLFEKRIALLEELQRNDSVPELRLGLLFNENINHEYNAFQTLQSELVSIRRDLDMFIDFSPRSVTHMGEIYSLDDLLDLELDINEEKCTEEQRTKFELLCQIYEVELNKTGNGLGIKQRNYKSLRGDECKKKHEMETQKQTVLNLMKKYIALSIAPIETEGGDIQ